MFQIGQVVSYGIDGVCTITEMKNMKVGHTRSPYYVLKPIHRSGSTIFVPMNNEAMVAKMKDVLSASEINDLLSSVKDEEIAWIEDANERKTEYQKILMEGNRLEKVRLVRTLLQRRQHLQKNGKHLRSGDEQILREAEKLLVDEFSLVLKIPEEKVPEYIRTHVEMSA